MADYKGSLSKKKSSEKHEEPAEHGFHVKRLHQGYHVTRHHPDGSTTEHVANDLDEVHDQLEDHMRPAEGEMEANAMAAGQGGASEESPEGEQQQNV